MTGIADRRAERVVLRTLGIGAELNRTRDTNVENPQSRVGSGLGSRSPCPAGRGGRGSPHRRTSARFSLLAAAPRAAKTLITCSCVRPRRRAVGITR